MFGRIIGGWCEGLRQAVKRMWRKEGPASFYLGLRCARMTIWSRMRGLMIAGHFCKGELMSDHSKLHGYLHSLRGGEIEAWSPVSVCSDGKEITKILYFNIGNVYTLAWSPVSVCSDGKEIMKNCILILVMKTLHKGRNLSCTPPHSWLTLPADCQQTHSVTLSQSVTVCCLQHHVGIELYRQNSIKQIQQRHHQRYSSSTILRAGSLQKSGSSLSTLFQTFQTLISRNNSKYSSVRPNWCRWELDMGKSSHRVAGWTCHSHSQRKDVCTP